MHTSFEKTGKVIRQYDRIVVEDSDIAFLRLKYSLRQIGLEQTQEELLTACNH